jgi:hypothetical protein
VDVSAKERRKRPSAVAFVVLEPPLPFPEPLPFGGQAAALWVSRTAEI